MSRFLHFLALAAMMLAPMAMHGAAAAPAPHHAAVEAEHCGEAGQRQEETDRGRSADCAIACAAMACGATSIEPAPAPRAAFAPVPSPVFAGAAPGADPPPPRAS